MTPSRLLLKLASITGSLLCMIMQSTLAGSRPPPVCTRRGHAAVMYNACVFHTAVMQALEVEFSDLNHRRISYPSPGHCSEYINEAPKAVSTHSPERA